MCDTIMVLLQPNQPICSARMASTKKITINCEKTKARYPPKLYKAGDVLAALDLCVSTCMDDPSKTC